MEAEYPNRLRVAKSYPDNKRKCHIRLDPRTLSDLNLVDGDFVDLEGRERTTALAYCKHRKDRDVDTVRMDGFTRWNADVELGELVEIRRNNTLVTATRVTLSHPGNINSESSPADIDPEEIRQQLIDAPVIEGQIVPVTLTHEEHTSRSSVRRPVTTVRSSEHVLGFRVIDIAPEDTACITMDTVINLLDEDN